VVDGFPAAMAQCLVREWRSGRIAVVWVPGGPAGNRVGCHGLGEALRLRYGGWNIYLRANILEEKRPVHASELREAGWAPARVKVGHPLTFQLDLAAEQETRRKALSGNWRHNLNRAEQRSVSVEVWDETMPLDLVHAVYRETNRMKGIVQTLSLDDLSAMRKELGRDFTLVVAMGDDQNLHAIRGFGKTGDRAWDLIAGVSAVGRRQQYSNYLLMWQLLELARRQGVHLYDLGGADPVRAAGVFNFKKGLGGRMLPLMGEWEFATAEWLRWGANFAIWCRKGGL